MERVFSLSQEPGTADEIKDFAASFGVEFDIFDKVDVNGSHAHPLYRFLKARVNKGLGNFIKWNYEKVHTYIHTQCTTH